MEKLLELKAFCLNYRKEAEYESNQQQYDAFDIMLKKINILINRDYFPVHHEVINFIDGLYGDQQYHFLEIYPVFIGTANETKDMTIEEFKEEVTFYCLMLGWRLRYSYFDQDRFYIGPNPLTCTIPRTKLTLKDIPVIWSKRSKQQPGE